MRVRELQKLTDYWANRLGLTNWNITVRFAPESDMDVDGRPALGSNLWHAEMRQSTIKILRRSEEIEHTLIHELLHLVVDAPYGEYRRYDVVRETALNTIATALLAEKRARA